MAEYSGAKRNGAHHEIAFCRLIIIKSFHHEAKPPNGTRKAGVSRPENLRTPVPPRKEAAAAPECSAESAAAEINAVSAI